MGFEELKSFWTAHSSFLKSMGYVPSVLSNMGISLYSIPCASSYREYTWDDILILKLALTDVLLYHTRSSQWK